MSPTPPHGAAHRAALAAMPEDEVPAYLIEHSGLPGPRANLELMAAFAEIAPAALVHQLADRPDEYLRCCGVVGLGRLLAEEDDSSVRDELAEALTTRASDGSWRVREAVAMAAQRLGDASPERLLRLVGGWVHDTDPLVVRAGIAAVCEPRLLRSPGMAAAAADACQTATDLLVSVPLQDRRSRDVRTLRQALGYCWSVAVAADPARGLPRFLALPGDADADVAWIVRENRRKKRLASLVDPTSLGTM